MNTRDNRNRYSAHLVACYSARMGRLARFDLWAIACDKGRNVNARIAAVQLWAKRIEGSAGDFYEAARNLRALMSDADDQGARALADVVFDLADEMSEAGNDAREWASCFRNPNLYYGVPRG